MDRRLGRAAVSLLVGTLAVLAILVKSGVALGLSVIIAVVALALALRVWGFMVLRHRHRRSH